MSKSKKLQGINTLKKMKESQNTRIGKATNKNKFNINLLKKLLHQSDDTDKTFQKEVTQSTSPSRNQRKIAQSKGQGNRVTLTDNPKSQIKCSKKSLANSALEQLKAGKFRFLNEQLYTSSGSEAFQYFKKEHEAFVDYHIGFQQQVVKWPINPVNIIIKDLKMCGANLVIADFGCGDAQIAQTFPERTIHSFDLVALNSFVTQCDISKTPLKKESVDIAVFCLSLMGTNFQEYIQEASRVLKVCGVLYIAEVSSRFEDPQDFVRSLKMLGYKLLHQDWSNKMFGLLKLQKKKEKINTKKLYNLKLNPCVYKKR